MIGTESEFEEATLERLNQLGYTYAFGEELERDKRQVVLLDRLRAFLTPRYPEEAVEFAVHALAHPDGDCRNSRILPRRWRPRGAQRVL